MEKTRERRLHERFRPAGDVFLAFRPSFERVGRILDISAGGIAVEYASDLGPLECGQVLVDIFMKQKNTRIRSLPCQVVYDIEEPSGFEWGGVSPRRCGLKFQALAEEHLSELRGFFSDCTLVQG